MLLLEIEENVRILITRIVDRVFPTTIVVSLVNESKTDWFMKIQ